jgi:hypothetical protein
MKVILKPKNAGSFTNALMEVRKTLVGENSGFAWIYKTDKGVYTFYKGMGKFAFVQFEGKRRSFGMSPYFKIKRVKRAVGKDRIRMLVGEQEFEMEITAFESSAADKPFWVNCSKSEYRALQKLKAY